MNWLLEEELEELKENLNHIEGEERAEVRFEITDLSSLNWALRKLSALEKRHDEDMDLRNEEMHRIARWHEKQEASYLASKDLLESLVKEYAKKQREIDPKWKQKTPYGLVSFRKGKKYNYGDEDKLVNHLIDNGMSKFVKVVKTPIKTELKKALAILENGHVAFEDTGELLPNVTAEETEDVVIKL